MGTISSAAWRDAVVAAVAVSYRPFCVSVDKRRARKVVLCLGSNRKKTVFVALAEVFQHLL